MASKNQLLIPSVYSLANQFGKLMRSTLTAEQMAEVVEGNRAESNSNVYHSGDFCDSNMVLHEVVMRYGMHIADKGGAEKWGHLWGAAWTFAKTWGFAMFKRSDIVEIIQEFQDRGYHTLTWIVQTDEEEGRVDLAPHDVGGAIKPTYTVTTDWIRLNAPKTT